MEFFNTALRESLAKLNTDCCHLASEPNTWHKHDCNPEPEAEPEADDHADEAWTAATQGVVVLKDDDYRRQT